ncbi:MAG: acyl-CoA dehydrogenase family protein [Sphingomonadales bacterium]|nr:acyl-CoA dehydrogenase family protein [Sphingomonadaceae bacterium]MBS3932548.1 acyl-CoA dehydrogenase family protein [Sphingomonadales bacterium]
MDFSDSPQEAAYRAKVRQWLEQNRISAEEIDADPVGAARAWQARKAAAGFACITWPKDWGGPGGSQIEQIIFTEEEAIGTTPENLFMIGLGMCIPTLMFAADDETKRRFVAPALRGEQIWCQLFSEPGAGSDLAAVRTKALSAGDGTGDWLVSGQKVWTSKAHLADFGIILCRSDFSVPKHKGLTMFWIDMKSPGIEIVPITRMNGVAGFNEVFLDAVRIPDAQRLGAIGEGWKVAVTTLAHERYAVGGTSGPGWQDLLAYAKERQVGGDDFLSEGDFRASLADLYLMAEGLRHTRNRTITALARGNSPGPEMSINKVVGTRYMMDCATLALEVMGPFGLASDAGSAAAQFRNHFLTSPGSRIAGGTDEIMKNIIAERVLGLPPEVQPDRERPFDAALN